MLGLAFRAQRSVEIYILEDQIQNVYYDIGYVHPDLEANYVYASYFVDIAPGDSKILDNRTTALTVLQAAYNISSSRLLKPGDMQSPYNDYFAGDNPPHKDTLRLAYDDPEIISTFRNTLKFTFTLDASTLPREWHGTKIQVVGIALVGATGQGNQVSCKFEHGPIYTERMNDGSMKDTILKSRYEIIAAPITPIQPGAFDPNVSPPIDSPSSSPLWAMGIGGMYTLSVLQSELDLHHPTFDGLKTIEIWFGYQFID